MRIKCTELPGGDLEFFVELEVEGQYVGISRRIPFDHILRTTFDAEVVRHEAVRNMAHAIGRRVTDMVMDACAKGLRP